MSPARREGNEIMAGPTRGCRQPHTHTHNKAHSYCLLWRLLNFCRLKAVSLTAYTLMCIWMEITKHFCSYILSNHTTWIHTQECRFFFKANKVRMTTINHTYNANYRHSWVNKHVIKTNPLFWFMMRYCLDVAERLPPLLTPLPLISDAPEGGVRLTLPFRSVNM